MMIMDFYLSWCVLLLANFTSAFAGQNQKFGNQNPSS